MAKLGWSGVIGIAAMMWNFLISASILRILKNCVRGFSQQHRPKKYPLHSYPALDAVSGVSA